MGQTVNSKEALMMLDTDIDQDMAAYQQEVTKHAIRYINKTPELYNQMKNTQSRAVLQRKATQWAQEHNNEFGDLFQTELESVDWAEVRRKV